MKKIDLHIHTVKTDSDSPFIFCMDTLKKYVAEVKLDAILSIADKGFDGKAYPVGSGKGRRLSEYIEAIRNIINPSIDIKYGVKEYYPHQPMHLVADVEKMTVDTGWKHCVPFLEGLERFI